jgi:hypothetical protein
MDPQDHPRPRAVDHSNQYARKAVSDIVDRFTPWRLAIAQMKGRAQHRRVLSREERQDMLDQCDGIANGLLQARTDLLIDLAEAPIKVTAHSRVVDVERALDNLEASLLDLRHILEQAN